jgi:hypothetical protein
MVDVASSPNEGVMLWGGCMKHGVPRSTLHRKSLLFVPPSSGTRPHRGHSTINTHSMCMPYIASTGDCEGRSGDGWRGGVGAHATTSVAVGARVVLAVRLGLARGVVCEVCRV